MNVYKLFFIIVLISLNFTFLKQSIANIDISYLKTENECIFVGGNQKILLAGPKEDTYFFFQCVRFESKYQVNVLKKYFVSELLLAPTPRSYGRYVRAIEMLSNNRFKDDKELSYRLTACIPLKTESNESLISFLLKNKENYQKLCNIENGYITLDKKTFLYDRKNNQFSIRKSYLIKGDQVSVSDYIFEKNVLWIFVNFKDSTKNWVQLIN